MKFLSTTFDTPEENLACDEALLHLCTQERDEEILRFWESPRHFVVLGYANRTKADVNLTACEHANIPVLRRCTGGGAVLQGPGCLNYGLILHRTTTGPLQTIAGTNAFVLNKHTRVLTALLGSELEFLGTSDLALAGRKFSGNAQRRKGNWILYHGTFLIGFDIRLIGELLPLPSKQPDYRRGRSHTEFLTNLKTSSVKVKEALQNAWHVKDAVQLQLQEEIDRLVRTQYARQEWIHRL